MVAPALGSNHPTVDAGSSDSEDTGERREPSSDTSAGGIQGRDACTPKTCEQLGVECGRASDGCGETLDCGKCTSGSSGVGEADACVVRTCQQDECGMVSDGCGGEMACGTCAASVCDVNLPVQSFSRTGRAARSAGFVGTTDEYFEMYEFDCDTASECRELCSVRGGSEAMCGASECSGPEGDKQCLPTTIWTNLEGILFASDDPTQAVELTAIYSTYHDTLLVDDFQLEIPSDATIVGLGVDIRRMGTDIADYSVKLVKDGKIVGGERARSALWGDEFEWISYGGVNDSWANSWTVADLLKPNFGVALSVVYAERAGHARAYVDQVRVTVHFVQGCGG